MNSANAVACTSNVSVRFLPRIPTATRFFSPHLSASDNRPATRTFLLKHRHPGNANARGSL